MPHHAEQRLSFGLLMFVMTTGSAWLKSVGL